VLELPCCCPWLYDKLVPNVRYSVNYLGASRPYGSLTFHNRWPLPVVFAVPGTVTLPWWFRFVAVRLLPSYARRLLSFCPLMVPVASAWVRAGPVPAAPVIFRLRALPSRRPGVSCSPCVAIGSRLASPSVRSLRSHLVA